MNYLRQSFLRKLSRQIRSFSNVKEPVEFNYDLSQEIVVSHYPKVLVLGMNLRDNGHLLTDTALLTLKERLEEFNYSDEYTAAVLHGIGGSFCSGIDKSASRVNGEELLKTMSKLQKPTFAAISGFTNFYGFQLALMCDFRVMEVTAVLGLGKNKEKDDIFPVVCERLVALTSLTTALDVVLTGSSYNYTDAFALGIINRWVECGVALGKCVNVAAGISKYPLEQIMREKKLVLSFKPENRFDVK